MADDDGLVTVDARRHDPIEDEHPARVGFCFLPADRIGELKILGFLETELGDFAVGQQQVLLLPANQADFSVGSASSPALRMIFAAEVESFRTG